MKPKGRVLYGEANFPALRQQNGYYVDKTAYIPLLEKYHSPVFLRPRRFGKSFWCSTLATYFDVRFKDDFETFFGDTWIGANPTPGRNSCLCLALDFSIIEVSKGIEAIEQNFNYLINLKLKTFLGLNRAWFQDRVTFDRNLSAAVNLSAIGDAILEFDLPRLFLTIDEYDNFANQLIVSKRNSLYHELTGDGGFLKAFFKTLKLCRGSGAIRRTFITGVLPITIDELASGYNIAQFITLEPKFEAMLGFTPDEVAGLLDQAYADYEIDPETRPVVEKVIKVNYNGYRFLKGESLYNSTILMYFLEKFCDYKQIPEFLTDPNLKTDISWVRRITDSNADLTLDLVSQLILENRISYSKMKLTEKFNMSQFFSKEFFPISFFYLGMFTRHDDFYMCLPNQNMRAIFSEYYNELYEVSVSGPYGEMMSSFAAKPDLPALFSDYWRLYISQFPEAVFQKVNENFYRTTFFDLCRQNLSHLYTWSLESSLASGRTDLEMAGQFHTRFAGDRYVLEFKYISNTSRREQNIKIEDFEARPKDLAQLTAYTRERQQQAPKENILAYLIYCFGNQGYRLFPMTAENTIKACPDS